MSDPITEAAAMLAAHPDPMVRLIAERLAGARVRRRAAGLSRDDVARRIGLSRRDRREIGGATAVGYFRARSLTEGGYVAWVLRLVEIGEGEGSCAERRGDWPRPNIRVTRCKVLSQTGYSLPATVGASAGTRGCLPLEQG